MMGRIILLLMFAMNLFAARLELTNGRVLRGGVFVKDSLITVKAVNGYYQYNFSLVRNLRAGRHEWLAYGPLVEMRKEADLTSEIILNLTEGTSLRSLDSEAQNGFFRVRVYDQEGWVSEKSLTKELLYTKLPNPLVEVSTQKGVFLIELFENEAPNTTANFISLAEKQFYDGLKVFRRDENFLVQTGDPTGSGEGGPGYRIANELNPLLENQRGFVGMADAGLNTAGSQFYILLANAPHLDGRYTVFGRVTEGMEVVDLLAIDDVILNMRVLSKRDHAYIPETLPLD
jgi:cyclophilin family peptidyl-prolyl cis-trans isomerase